MKRLALQADALDAHFKSLATKTKGVYSNAKSVSGMQNLRKQFDDITTGSGEFFARQLQVTSATETFTKKLADQKVTFSEAIRNRQMFNKVLREQIALQNASAVQWSKSSSGKLNATLYQPQQLSAKLADARTKMGLFNTMMASGADQMVKWGKNTQWAGRQLMVGFTVPIAIAAAATGKLAYDTDKALTQITKVYGDASKGVQESVQSIRDQAMATATTVTSMFGQSSKDTLGIMAQLAASGKTGNELQQATLATSRAAVLGELDWQDAVKATISLQEVYHHNAQEIGDDFNYINAMENQTVLTSQDFVTAIPKVAGVMNALGADLKQTGTLLTAFKAAGIDAAEGANALKSINFRLVATYGKGLATFKAMTGQDLRQIIDETNGETIPTLDRFAAAIANLSAPQKIAVTRDVFGIYQGSKALLLLQQMVEKTDQWNQAINVANNSLEQNAAIANQELARLNERPFMRIKKAVEQMKNSLAKAGEEFLKLAAPAMEFIGRMIEGFNTMNPALKKFLVGMALAVGAIGPIVMMTGLIGNLVGNLLKFASVMLALRFRFKLMSAEQRTQELLSKQAAQGWDTQTAAVARLSLELDKFTKSYKLANAKSINRAGRKQEKEYETNEKRLVNSAKYGVDTTPWMGGPRQTDIIKAQDKLGRTYYNNAATGKRTNADAYDQANKQFKDARAAHNAEQLAKAMGHVQTEAIAMNKAFDLNRMHGYAQGVGMAAGGLGSLLLMFGNTENAAVGLSSKMLIATSIAGTMFPAAMARAMLALKSFGTMIKLNAAVLLATSGGFQRLKGLVTGMLPMLKGLAAGFGILAIAGVIAWKQITDSMEENRKKMEDYGNAAKTLADTIGYAYQTTTSFNMTPKGTNKQSRQELTAKFSETEEGKALIDVTKSQLTGDAAKDVATIWDEAIAAAMKAKMHGATEEQAKLTARVVLGAFAQTMNMTDSQFEVNFHNLINFDDTAQQVTAVAKELRRQFNVAWADEGQGSENWFRNWVSGQDDLSAGGLQRIKDTAKEQWQILAGADPKDRQKIFDEQFKAINGELMSRYENLQKTQGEWMKSQDLNSFDEFLKDNWDVNIQEKMGIGDEQFRELLRQKDGVKVYLDEWTRAAGITNQGTTDFRNYFHVLSNIPDFFQKGPSDAEMITMREDAMSSYIQEIQRMGPAYDKMSEADKLALLNTYRLKGGLKETGNVLDWFSTQVTPGAVTGVNDLAASLKKAGISAEITADQAKESFRNVTTGVIDMVQENRQDQVEAHWSAYVDRIQREGEAAVEAADKAADKAKDKLEDKWTGINDREQKAQENARKAMEKAYDARVKAVDKAIEAEQKAEEARQRIFEAEKTRLQRMSELYNDSIDISVAISTGKLDDAAKLQNDMAAKRAGWALDDAAAGASTVSEKKIESLQDKKDRIQEEKQTSLDALKEVQDARDKALAAQKKSEERALEASNAAKKEAARKDADRNNKNAKQYVDARKKSLEQELALIRSYVPRNQAEMNEQIRKIDALYAKYGVSLKSRGQGWARSVAAMLTYQTAIEGNKLATIVNWAKVGADIATAMLQGAFGMNAKQFGIWLNGGEAPTSSPLSSKFNAAQFNKMMQQRKVAHNESVLAAKGIAFHTGGTVGMSPGGRTGHTGERSAGEVDARLLVGEGVLNRKAMKFIGTDGLNQLNTMDSAGGGMGGGGMLGLGSLPGAMLAPMAIRITRSAIAGAARKRLGFGAEAGAPSIASGVAAAPSATEIVKNAIANIVGTVSGNVPSVSGVKTTGQVIYLGHNNAYDGRANLGPTSRPATGVVVSEFGPRNLLGMKFHNGIDIANGYGTPTRAVAAGRVQFTGWENSGYGNYIQIKHPDGSLTGYGHHQRILVSPGQAVKPGQQIGEMGSTGKSTGPHVHFQVGRNGNWFNPRKLFPGLADGGFTLNDGYAMLHKKEAVIPEPLTTKFRDGLDAFANNGTNQYNVNITVEGDGDADKIARVVKSTLRDIDKASGPSRRISGNA